MHYMVCVDGSEESEVAFKEVAERVTSSDSVTLLSVVKEVNENILTSVLVGGDPYLVEDANQHRMEERLKMVEKYKAEIVEKGCLVNCILADSYEKSELADIILKYEADLSPNYIVMGRSHTGGIVKRTLFGSTLSEYIAKHAKCEVLLYRVAKC